MSLFSIADLHLSLATDKPMDKFGPRWQDHTEKLRRRWNAVVCPEDTVVVPGDISWAISLDEALEDLKFIDSLPGTKLLGKGNHDYWWTTLTKMNAFLDKKGIGTIRFLYNNAYDVGDWIVAGTRGWYVEEKLQSSANAVNADYRKIVARENIRLELCLKEAESLSAESGGKKILAYFHFPPVFNGFVCRELVNTLKAHGITDCYFGHIHGLYNVPRSVCFEGINFTIVSADYLDFIPMITMPFD